MIILILNGIPFKNYGEQFSPYPPPLVFYINGRFLYIKLNVITKDKMLLFTHYS